MYVSAAIEGLGTLTNKQLEIRQKLATDVASLTVKMANSLQAAIDGDFSTWSMLSKGVVFWPNLISAKDSLKRAKEQLLNQFLPIAQTAIMDPARDLNEIKSSLDGYIKALEQQIKISLKTRDGASFSSVLSEAFEVAKTATRAVADAVLDYTEERLDPTKSLLPWAIGGGVVGLFLLYKILR